MRMECLRVTEKSSLGGVSAATMSDLCFFFLVLPCSQERRMDGKLNWTRGAAQVVCFATQTLRQQSALVNSSELAVAGRTTRRCFKGGSRIADRGDRHAGPQNSDCARSIGKVGKPKGKKKSKYEARGRSTAGMCIVRGYRMEFDVGCGLLTRRLLMLWGTS